jgi:hypothetical protein
MWKSGNVGMWKCAALMASVSLIAASNGADDYSSVVEQFATSPNAAVEKMLAMPRDEVERGVHEAARADSGWTTDAIDRALLMHGDAILMLTKDRRDTGLQLTLADELALAAARRPGNEWFVHRWFKAVTAKAAAKVLEAHWRQQGWFQTATIVDRARELELDGDNVELRVDTEVYDPTPFRQAIPLLEQGVAAHFSVAAVHLGRIQMLRGNETDARRLLASAARDETSRVTRYLANLFLGSMDEREYTPAAEDHYRRALEALPRAQSGRLALSALLARTGRDADARRAITDSGPSPFYDPWWSYFRGTARDSVFILAELHAEVCR